jgi:hypothetical protein
MVVSYTTAPTYVKKIPISIGIFKSFQFVSCYYFRLKYGKIMVSLKLKVNRYEKTFVCLAGGVITGGGL